MLPSRISHGLLPPSLAFDEIRLISVDLSTEINSVRLLRQRLPSSLILLCCFLKSALRNRLSGCRWQMLCVALFHFQRPDWTMASIVVVLLHHCKASTESTPRQAGKLIWKCTGTGHSHWEKDIPLFDALFCKASTPDETRSASARPRHIVLHAKLRPEPGCKGMRFLCKCKSSLAAVRSTAGTQ